MNSSTDDKRTEPRHVEISQSFPNGLIITYGKGLGNWLWLTREEAVELLDLLPEAIAGKHQG